MLLAVVVVAVATAVAARAPLLTFSTWYHLIADGVVAASVALACVWIVCGRARWWIRLAAAPVLAIVLAVVNQAFRWALYLANLWYQGTPGTIAEYLEATRRDSWPGVTYWIIATSVGMGALCAWLFAMTRAGWFDLSGESFVEPATAKSRRRIVVAQVGAVLLFGLVAMFPLALLYQLMVPTPIPDVKLPEPNAFDDFVVAGRMIGPVSSKKVSNWDQISESELAAEMAKLAPAFARFREGFKKRCWNPYVFTDWDMQDDQAIIYLSGALRGQVAFARNSRDAKLQLETDLDWLRLSHAIGQGMASLNQNIFYQYETDVQENIWVRAGSLDSAACTQLATELWQMDRRRDVWSVIAERHRIIDVNSDWQRRADATLQKWSGIERYPMAKHEHLIRAAQLRMLILKLSLRAFELDTGRLPASLAELVPKYLPSVPADPYASERIKYRPNGSSYKLYCNGPDGDDDGGLQNSMLYSTNIENGDATDAELFPEQPAAKATMTGSR